MVLHNSWKRCYFVILWRLSQFTSVQSLKAPQGEIWTEKSWDMFFFFLFVLFWHNSSGMTSYPNHMRLLPFLMLWHDTVGSFKENDFSFLEGDFLTVTWAKSSEHHHLIFGSWSFSASLHPQISWQQLFLTAPPPPSWWLSERGHGSNDCTCMNSWRTVAHLTKSWCFSIQ